MPPQTRFAAAAYFSERVRRMRILDITRELTGAPVYPGDPAPRLEAISRLAYGDSCDLTVLHACLHNGTHMDAPRHFVPDGADAAALSLESCVGGCSVVEWQGEITGEDAEKLLPHVERRLLFKGEVEVTPSAAFVFAAAPMLLIGVEAPSVASAAYTGAVHKELLGAGVLLLEGLDLSQAEEGRYDLVAAPLRIAGADGAPVRAFLLPRNL